MQRLLTYHKLLYFYFQEYLFDLPAYEKKNFTGPTFFQKLKNIIVAFLYVLKMQRRSHDKVTIPPGKDWVFVFDRNNYESTKFLSLDNDVLYVTERKRIFPGSDNIVLLPVRRRLWDYYLFPILIPYLLIKEGARVFDIIDLIFNSLGWVEAFDRIVKAYSPNSITFSNDHSFVPRALFLAAQANNIQTVYVQHAVVTKSFPPLEFDLSLLEGMDALDKYNRKGIKNGTVKLVGIPRFDQYVKFRRSAPSTRLINIGFAFNTVDSIERVFNVISMLCQILPETTFILRKHPKDRRDFRGPLQEFSNVKFSNSYEQSSFDFILTCDVLIAGDSSIHLDARLLNVESFYFNFSIQSGIRDLYGFLKNGLVKELSSTDSIIDLIKAGLNGEDIFMKAKYYNSLVGEENEAAASELAFKEFTEFKKKVLIGYID